MAPPDFTIHRCTLRVTRRGGWSWGADGRTLTQVALKKLPALLAARFDAYAEGLEDDVEVAAAVRLNVRLTRKEWNELCSTAPLAADCQASIDVTIDRALASALPRPSRTRSGHAESARLRAHSSQVASEAGVAPALESAVVRDSASALFSLLLQWQQEGRLPDRLCVTSEEILHLWIARLIDTADSSSSRIADAQTLTLICDIQRDVAAIPLLLPAGRLRTLARRVLFLLRVLKETPLTRAELYRHVYECWPLDTRQERQDAVILPHEDTARAAAHGDTSPSNAELARRASTAVASLERATDTEFEWEVPCALPFLMLRPLAGVGFLTTLAGVCDAARIGSLSGAIAAALARKALAPPTRGWHRDDGHQASVAAFAASPAAVSDSLIAAAARALRPQLTVLDRCITENLVRGHRAETAWLLAASPSGDHVLFDADTLTAVASGSCASLLVLASPSGSPVFVHSSAATTANFDALDDLQTPYATDANLSARKTARSFVARDGRTLWMSVHGSHEGRRRDLAAHGVDLSERAGSAWRAVVMDRPSLRAGGDEAAFERTLSLAANLALGELAWILWRGRGQTDPSLALEWFGDFDARVRVTRTEVGVRLPLGRRFWDLRDHGLLADVREIPWLGQRVVRFGAG